VARRQRLELVRAHDVRRQEEPVALCVGQFHLPHFLKYQKIINHHS
jgi:hypothetical protein